MDLPLQYHKQRVISSCRGFEPGQFSAELRGLAIDGQGNVYAAGDSLVTVLTSEGRILRSWPTERPPYAVAVAPDGRVYVGQEGQLQIFDDAGRLLDTWRDADRLGLVTAIGVTGAAVIIADVKDRCLRRFDRAGRFLHNIGKDNRMKGFLVPNRHLDFVIDAQDIIHAANPGQHRIQHFTLAGQLLGRFGHFDGRDPAGFTGCCNPTNLALTPEGHIVTVEKAPPRVKVYTAEGELLAVMGTGDLDPNCKNSDVAVDAQGRIYVVDTARLLIVVYAPDTVSGTKRPATAPATQEVRP